MVEDVHFVVGFDGVGGSFGGMRFMRIEIFSISLLSWREFSWWVDCPVDWDLIDPM